MNRLSRIPEWKTDKKFWYQILYTNSVSDKKLNGIWAKLNETIQNFD